MKAKILIIAIILCSIVTSLPALAIIIGAGSGATTSQLFEGTGVDGCTFGGCDWNIGSSASRIDVTFDPNAGKWIKTLTDHAGRTIEADDEPIAGFYSTVGFNLFEWLIVDGTIPWTDWHQEILTPGWTWASGEILVTRPDGSTETVVGSISNSFGPDAAGNVIDFIFNSPLLPGTTLDISKSMSYTGIDGAFSSCGIPACGDYFNGTIQIAQHPTVGVAEPWSISIFCLALAGLVRLRRK